ncbi:GntR family transcriptional regulator [Anaerostipes sp.]|uniref:GntR family transcriptional regulator n=1 Tax=Anaerostipes sp. TaxID=1872530 RepID=UPI0025B9FF98|nr:GntR family transcriptional regulator [Anaerostipes sp.]MBS7007003.1 GntR family transcriptional regulator [Anaerostipes sp.]
MKQKQTLFDYVYGNLKEQILSGRLQYGEKLPSMNSLSEFYHVGIRTVKDVLHLLREEGYIRTEERKAAVVVYRQAGKDTAVRSVLGRKSSIIAVYQTILVLVPPLLSFCARRYSKNELSQMFAGNLWSKKRSPQELGRICVSCIYELLDHSKNLLFRDLFASLEIYARMPFFQNYDHFAELVLEYNEFHSIQWVLEAFTEHEPSEIVSRFRRMFHSVVPAVCQFMEELSGDYGEITENPSCAYCWTAECGRDHYYMQIARDLIDKIGTGSYKEGSFLPSESQLARQYGVCVSTVRNALFMLNDLGFGRTMNAKGTKVLLQDEDAAVQCLKNKTFRRDTMIYLSGLQLMAIAIKPAAAMAFDKIGEHKIQELKEHTKNPDYILLDGLVRCVTGHLELSPLKSILKETGKLLHWGYYFSFFGGISGSDLLAAKSLAALEKLECGSAAEFGEHMSHCFCHILDFVRDRMVEFGLSEAAGLISPCSPDTGK